MSNTILWGSTQAYRTSVTSDQTDRLKTENEANLLTTEDRLREQAGTSDRLSGRSGFETSRRSGTPSTSTPAVDHDSAYFNASLGRKPVAATLIHGSTVAEYANIETQGHVRVGTFSAVAELEIQGSVASRSISGKVAVGAEAMLVEVSTSARLELNIKKIVDTTSGFYNTVIDPVFDKITGQDLPEMRQVSSSWDRGVTLGAQVSAGWGAAAHVLVQANVSSGGIGLAAAGKLTPTGFGPVSGFAISVQVD